MNQRAKTGVIIGKFLPPHRGHKYLIDTAQSQVEHLTIIICDKKSDPIPGYLREAWIREIYPQARVLLIDDYYDNDDDSELWARLTIGWLGYVPDIAFTSENYGFPWSAAMGCQHVQVDYERTNVPISGTRVRANPLASWDYLEPVVRAHFARRIVVLGAESTGTTTLSMALAEHFQTAWVPEYGREYCETRNIGADYTWRSEEFATIAAEQLRRENLAAREANKVLICDTDAFATRIWHWRYMGFFSPQVDEIAFSRLPALYLLTDVNIPFIQDGWRDGEHIRSEMHAKFAGELEKTGVPWALISGSPEKRLQDAVTLIEEVVKVPFPSNIASP